MTGRKVLFNRVLLALIVGTLVKVLSAEPIHDDPTMLDFWIGEWDLSWKAGEETKKGTNSISRILDGAVIEESFNGLPGMDFKGRSYSLISRSDGKWKQVWIDSARGYLDFEGFMLGDKVYFQRTGQDPNGKTIHQRMVFYEIEDSGFTWDWETSPDGETWSLKWRIDYKRRAD